MKNSSHWLTGDEEGEMDSMDELPQHKVTDYKSVYIVVLSFRCCACHVM